LAAFCVQLFFLHVCRSCNCVSKNVPSFNIRPPVFKIVGTSSADIQSATSATDTAFSATLLLVNLLCSEVKRWKWCIFYIVIPSWEQSVIDKAVDQRRPWLCACVKTMGHHFEHPL